MSRFRRAKKPTWSTQAATGGRLRSGPPIARSSLSVSSVHSRVRRCSPAAAISLPRWLSPSWLRPYLLGVPDRAGLCAHLPAADRGRSAAVWSGGPVPAPSRHDRLRQPHAADPAAVRLAGRPCIVLGGLAAPYARSLLGSTLTVGLLMAAMPLDMVIGAFLPGRVALPSARIRMMGWLAVLRGGRGPARRRPGPPGGRDRGHHARHELDPPVRRLIRAQRGEAEAMGA
jgi:hypothetical protein